MCMTCSDIFTEIETSGKFYEKFKRATMPAKYEYLTNGKMLITWYVEPMSDAHADYKLTSLEEFIHVYRY